MGLNRRGFFNVLAVTGASLAVGKKTLASPKVKKRLNSTGFYTILPVAWLVAPASMNVLLHMD